MALPDTQTDRGGTFVKFVPRGLLGVVLFAAGLAVGGLGVYTWEHRPSSLPRRLEATVLLPTQDDKGAAFPDERWQEALRLLVDECGGATVGPPQEGWWQDDSKSITREPVRPVVVSFPKDRLAGFRVAVTEAGRRLGQRAVYVRYEEPRLEILPIAEYGK
jgi:hypothetical protein